MALTLCRRPPENTAVMTLIPVEKSLFSFRPAAFLPWEMIPSRTRLSTLLREDPHYDPVDNALFLRLPKSRREEDLEAFYRAAFDAARGKGEDVVLFPLVPAGKKGDFAPALNALRRAYDGREEETDVYFLWCVPGAPPGLRGIAPSRGAAAFRPPALRRKEGTR